MNTFIRHKADDQVVKRKYYTNRMKLKHIKTCNYTIRKQCTSAISPTGVLNIT